MQATTRSAMEQITKSPEELWQSREGTLVAKLPKPQGPYDGIVHPDIGQSTSA